MNDRTVREETRRKERTLVIRSRNVCGGLSGGGSGGSAVDVAAVDGCI